MNKFLHVLFMILLVVSFTSCDKDSPDNPDNPNGGTEKPDNPVADPPGTIILKMRNKDNGKTYLDDIYIDEGNNFTGAKFVDVGPVAGLGNITSIPKVGWTSTVAVNPGHGYVAYSNGVFYRMYVTGWTLTTGDLIIGAEVKYQKNFPGKNEDLMLDAQSLTFDKEGGEQGIVINNTSIIPFSVTCSAQWCTVHTASTTNFDFLTDAIKIYVQPNSSISSSEATITLTTIEGKVAQIKVIRLGASPLLEFQSANVTLRAEEGTQDIPVLTNIALDKISATSSADWMTVSLTDDTYRIRQKSSTIKYVDGIPASRSGNEESGAHSYNIHTKYSTNYDGGQRQATISLRYQSQSASIDVTQQGADFQFVEVEGTVASSTGNAMIYATSDIPDGNLTVSSDKEWCTATFSRNGSRATYSHCIDVTYDANRNADDRVAHIDVLTPDNKTLATYTLTQLGASIDVATGQQPIIIDCKGTENMSFTIRSPFESEELVVASSESWIRGEINPEGKLVVEAEYNHLTEDREASLTISAKNSNVTSKINFKQAKGWLKVQITSDKAVTLAPSATLYRQKKAVTETYTIETSFAEIKPKSSADWCVISTTRDKLVVRISESPDINRDCQITFEGTPCVLNIKQIKYNLGDEYIGSSETYSGRLIFLNDTTGEAVMSKELAQKLAWSTERVETGATNLYDGIKNTEAIKSIPNWQETYPAFAAVDALNDDTDAGWHIPACEEGKDGWIQAIKSIYWSSTSMDEFKVYQSLYGDFFYRYSTNNYWGYKSEQCYVLAVRRFKIE